MSFQTGNLRLLIAKYLPKRVLKNLFTHKFKLIVMQPKVVKPNMLPRQAVLSQLSRFIRKRILFYIEFTCRFSLFKIIIKKTTTYIWPRQSIFQQQKLYTNSIL